MGYDLHITRKENHYDPSEPSDINQLEWEEYVKEDPEMILQDKAVAEIKGSEAKFVTSGPGLAVWTKYSKNYPGFNMAWFSYYDGCVDVKNPDDEIIQKMKEIATKMNARVVGDEGEEY